MTAAIASTISSSVSPETCPHLWILVLDNVATLPLLTLSRVWCGLVKPGDFLSLMSKYFAPLGDRQFHESTAIFESKCRGFLQLVFLRNHHPEFTTLGIRDQSISRTGSPLI